MLNRFKIILFFLLFHQSTMAQFTGLGNKNFTRADSLAGSVTPERAWWDVIMYDLDVEPNLEKFAIKGKNTIHFTLSNTPNSRMQIDLQEPMMIDSAFLDKQKIKYSRDENIYYIELTEKQLNELKNEYKSGTKKQHQLLIYFKGIPKPALYPPWDGGLVWQKDKEKNPWIGVACQGDGASCWWPCKDHPYDEPDSTLISVTTPKSLMNVSNGKLRGSYDLPGGKKKWQWFVSNPINIYNITMNVGNYAHFKDTMQGENGVLELDYYVLNYNLERAKQHFQQVKPALHALEYWMGPYPFYKDGYKLVETPYLGMEHQSAVAYGNKYLNGYMGSDYSGSGWGADWDYIIVHESGHEWFGNNVSCNDVADMWIHEGFTTYSEVMYVDYHYGKKAGDEYVRGLLYKVVNDKPIKGFYNVKNEGSSDMYSKSAGFIHTLRTIINNDSLFRNIIRGIQSEFKLKQIPSTEIESYISQKSGINFQKTFEQYLSTTQIPTLEYYVKKNNNKFELFYRWNNCIKEFDMPIWLPESKTKMKLSSPTQDWRSMETSIQSTNELSQLLNKNFYVKYKEFTPSNK